MHIRWIDPSCLTAKQSGKIKIEEDEDSEMDHEVGMARTMALCQLGHFLTIPYPLRFSQDHLSLPYLLSLPMTAWETSRPSNPQSRLHLMPLFPLVEETKYHTDQPYPAIQDICQPLHQRLCVRDRQQVCIAYMRYRRNGPKVFEQLRELVAHKKKLR